MGSGLKTLFLGFLFVTLFVFLSVHSQNEVLHEDEWFFIRRAEFFDLYFLKHDFDNPLWYGFHGIDQPFISYYFYGLTLHLNGISDIKAALNQTNFEQTMPEWDARGNQKQILWKELYERQHLPLNLADKFYLIKLGRIGAVFLLTVCIIALFFILKNLLNYIYALAGSGLFLSHPITREYGNKALADQPLLLLLLLTPVLGLSIIKEKSTNSIYLKSVLMGLLGALAFGVKPNGILTLIFYYLLISSFIFFKQRLKPAKLKALFFSPLISIITACLLIYILHPNLWPDPVNKFLAFFQFRWKIIKLQAGIWPETSLLGSWLLKPKAFVNNLFYFPLKLDFLVFFIGFVRMILKLFKRPFNNRNLSTTIFTLWHIFLIISFLIYIPLNWQRYYWILVPGIIFFQAFGLKILKNMILLIGKIKLQYIGGNKTD
jgi:hypothetical protein